MDTKNYLDALIEANRKDAVAVRAKNKVGSSTVEAYGFIVGGLKILYPEISLDAICDSITDNDFDEQIDAIVIADGFVDIYDFKMSVGFGENDIRLFRESVDKLIFTSDSDLTKCDALVRKKIIEARHFIEDENYNVRIRVVRGGGNSAYPQGEKALKELTYTSVKEHRLISLIDLISIELNLNIMPIKYDWKITAKKNNTADTSSQIIIKENSNITSLICRISLKEIVDFYHEFQPTPDRIFESNVRGLQNNKKVSSQILSSVADVAKSKNFYKLHNGLTIVCDNVKELTKSKYILVNPQIVNGCQTVTTISKHFEGNRSARELDYASVICKIFAADQSKVESICLASNSQVSINPWDLRSNDDIQKIIEAFLRKSGYKYNRKARMVNNSNDIVFPELGQWLCAVLLEKPAVAKNNRASIFNADGGTSSLYHQIFTKTFSLSELKKVVDYAIFIRNKIKALPISKRTYEVPANLHTLAGMYFLDSKGLTNEASYKLVNEDVKKVIVQMKKKHKDINYPAIFTKHDSTWKSIKTLLNKH